MRKAETTIVVNVVVNLIGVRLMRLIDVDAEIARIEEEIMKLTKAIVRWQARSFIDQHTRQES